jgi:phosphoesterase RecJ-like protein
MTMNWNEAKALVDSAHNIVIVTHVSPDGDAIGSLLGLAWSLRQLGKQVTVAVDDGLPAGFAFLPGAADIQANLNGVQPDLVIAVDCGDRSRMGEVGAAATAAHPPLINLDHHVTNTQFGDANLVDGGTVAAAEGVFDWLPRLGVTLDPTIATCLLTGIVTDTLCFRTDNVTAAVLGKAQQLMEAGAQLSDITQRTVMRMPYESLKLWSAVMPTVRMDNHVIWAVIDKATRESLNYTNKRDGGLVSLLVSADEAYISAVFREQDDGRVEIGFRAVPGFDVASVALALGGGGHALASGCTLDVPLAEAIDRVLPMLKDAAAKGSPVVT